MKKLLLVTVTIFGLTHLLLSEASALNAKSWISSTGSNTDDCSRATPCASFSGALGKTDPDGEIICVDAGNFGGGTIAKSITISCEPGLGSNSGSVISAGLFTVTLQVGERVVRGQACLLR